MTRRIRSARQARAARAVVESRRDTPYAIALRALSEHYRQQLDHLWDEPSSSESKEVP